MPRPMVFKNEAHAYVLQFKYASFMDKHIWCLGFNSEDAGIGSSTHDSRYICKSLPKTLINYACYMVCLHNI